jgi:hypothetical protein
MPTVKNVGEPCAREPHARFEVAAGGNQASRLRRAAQAPLADPTLTRHRDEAPAQPVRPPASAASPSNRIGRFTSTATLLHLSSRAGISANT